MLATRFTELVGCSHPLQQAGMGGVAGPELAGAVADAGALGMLGGVLVPAAALDETLAALAAERPGAIGVNFLMPFVDHEAVAVAAQRARVVEFFYAEPDAALVETVHADGALAAWQVGSVAEARAAADAGCDFVVAQGVEAGGHVRGEVALLPLLDAVLAAVDVPVVAAGGIGTAHTMAAVIAAGADGARVGTRFVAAREADAHPDYVRALVDAGPADTVLTEAYSVMWPNAPHRVLRSAIAAAEASDEETVGEVMLGGESMPIPRFSVPAPTRDTTGRVEAMALYAGQSVAAVSGSQPAASIVDEIAGGAESALRRWAS